jgi:hypothetical protein
VLFRKYLHGVWKYDEFNDKLVLTDESGYTQPVLLQVDSIGSRLLVLGINRENICKLIPSYENGSTGYSYLTKNNRVTFFLLRDKQVYWHEKNDPYSKINNQWRIKPSGPETDEQILARVDNHLHFWRLIVQDAIDKNSDYISFHWFASPVIVASNGSALRKYENVKDEWGADFYDSVQAQKGYQLLQKCFSKGLKAGETDSRFQNDLIIIDQMIENLHK